MRDAPGLVIGLFALAILAGCGGSKDRPVTQTAAKVNKEEITVHQINALLSQRGVAAEQTDKAASQALELLIDQELAVQKAAELKIDRDPRVLQAIEGAKREIISRAYADRISEAAPKPSPEEIKKYYDDNPALFRDRRVFQIQELRMDLPPDQLDGLRQELASAKTFKDVVDHLNVRKIKFTANQAVRSAEQIPLAVLPQLAKLKDGEWLLIPVGTGAVLDWISASRLQPIDFERASKAIELFLLNERRRKLVAGDLKALRSTAAISYVGKFAASAPRVGESQTLPLAADAPPAGRGLDLRAAAEASSAASDAKPGTGIDASTLSKGLGLK